jgi:molecular chaperone DnaK (HSP70)
MLCPDRRDIQSFHTPSVVYIKNGVIVGDAVEKLLLENASLNICRFAKRSMGVPDPIYSDPEGYNYPAHAISALILRKLTLDVESSNPGEEIEKVVVSVPAHFNEAQRRATVDAARLADLPIVGLVEEPVAAAAFVSSSLGLKRDEKTLFVFDLGGGTLDCTVLQSTADGLYVIATEGAGTVGGKNFDEVLMEIALSQYKAEFHDDPRSDPASMQALRMFSTSLKLELAKPANRKSQRPLLLNGRLLRVTVTREQFEEASAVLLDACADVCERALHGASMDWGDIDHLILTGGGSQLPCIENRLRELSRLGPDRLRHHQPRASVAYGVAILAEQLYGSSKTIAPPLRQTVSTNELGLTVVDPVTQHPSFHCLIEKNVPLPSVAQQTVYGDTTVSAHITIQVQQRKDEYTAPETLGRYQFGPLPIGRRNIVLNLELGYNEDGRTFVKVKDAESGKSLDQMIDDKTETDLANLMRRLSGLTIL